MDVGAKESAESQQLDATPGDNGPDDPAFGAWDPLWVHISDRPGDVVILPVIHRLQDEPLVPAQEFQLDVPIPQSAASNLFDSRSVDQSLLVQIQRRLSGPSASFVLGVEAKTRSTTDTGSLLKKTRSALGVGVQRRTPIVNDPRIRGSRVGQLAASGSYWVPARIDLDTMVSKIDSRIINDVIVIKGPYSAMYGPGVSFVDVELVPTPRYEDGFEWHGSTSVDYNANGQQWNGRQNLWGGGTGWGFRFGYGHATGNDYRIGGAEGGEVPSSYNSRDFNGALGLTLSDDSYLEFHYLRLRQKDVEFPGYAFDIDDLTTDGYEATYVTENHAYFDRLTFEVWHNQTQFDGSAQRTGKRKQFPFFDFIDFNARTNVDSSSTGFSLATTWGDDEGPQWTAGADLRYLTTQLNEFASGRIGFAIFDGNSPIPKSFSVNPGLFIEHQRPVNDRLMLHAGARVDLTSSEINDDLARLQEITLQIPQPSLAQVLGTSDFDQDRFTFAAYLTGDYELDCDWTLDGGVGYAQRPPSLTEYYVAESFLFLLQNGENTATGDPTLNSEQRLQVDLGINYDNDGIRAGARGYYAWLFDYITFENLRVFEAFGAVEQVNLQYVNTDLATLAGTEMYAEYDWNEWVTPFANLSYVQATDETRNGDFATMRGSAAMPATKVAGLPRGFFSGFIGAPQEPLPSIPPLESVVGARIHEAAKRPSWSIEIAARMVAPQHRIARSLFETPTPGFTVWDARGYWQARENLLLVAGIENFTDKRYREHLDFRSANGISVVEPGINAYVGGELTY